MLAIKSTLMNTIDPEDMRGIDLNCAYLGLEPLQLMENAGAGLARCIRKLAPGKNIAVVAGRGNNGGDAFVAARHLHDFYVRVYLIGRSKDITTPDALKNWTVLQRMSFDLIEVRNPEDLVEELKGFDLVVDALLGTGIKGSVKGPEAHAIMAMNSCKRMIIAVDVPSGMGTTLCTKADYTVTFHRPKTGLQGNYHVVDIGISPQAEFLVGPGDLKLLGTRRADSHKGDAGRILVIGGGPYSGAPALTASAALRAGADIVTVAAPKSVANIIAGFSPNLIVRALEGEHLSMHDLDVLQPLIESHDVTVIGMGLGRSSETYDALKTILPLCEKTVIDADALQPELLLKGIVTPHAGEFKRISGHSLPQKVPEKAEMVRTFAKNRGLVVLLKGKTDIISDGIKVRGNNTGNPGMTVGGTGDVLAGVTAAFYSIAPPLRAAVAAAYVNGLAGDIAFKEKGFGLVATDVIENLPKAIFCDGDN